MTRSLSLLLLCLSLASSALAETWDLVVYGSTPSGIAAAVVAARQGHKVALLEPDKYIGGLLTGGLSNTDFRTRESLTGFFLEYMNEVVRYYTKKYGADSPQVKECFGGVHAEPHVSTLVLKQIMAAQKTLTVLTRHRLISAERIPGTPGALATIRSITVRTPSGEPARFQGRMFLDASYEGDLAAAARVPWRLGRESTREYGERYAGVIYFRDGRILQGSTGEADRSVQCMNFRIIMTKRPEIRVPVPKPEGYRREEFLHILPHFRSGRLPRVFSADHSGIIRVTTVANGKADMNDIKNAPVRLSLAGEVDEWPEGNEETRQRIWQRHRTYALGLLWFLQNEPEIPAAIRAEASEWGLAKDEFPDEGYFPTALYVREGRRIVGEYIFTEHDTQPAPRSIRAPLHPDVIAIGDYSLNSHGHTPAGPLYPDLVEGDFGAGTAPFQIPYGTIVPKEVDNLLVTVAISASHVGYSALRLEPTWTALGHAGGLAAHLALTSGTGVHSVSVPRLQQLLVQQGQALIYTSDVPPGSPLFPAVQYLGGIHGLMHDVIPWETSRVTPLAYLYGTQYSKPFADLFLNPETPVDERLRKAWLARFPTLADRPEVQSARTRADLLAALYQNRHF